MNQERLQELVKASNSIAARATSLPREQAEAQVAFITALRENADPVLVEAARLRCSAIFEMQLDLLIEAARNQREIIQEASA